MCLYCWQFRLPLHSFVSVQNYFKYWLSINRKNNTDELKVSHGAVVRALAFEFRGREFESRIIHLPSNQNYLVFPCLPF